MSNDELAELDDRWILPIARETVDAVCIDYAVSLRFTNGVAVSIEQPFSYITADGTDHSLVPAGDPRDVAPVLGIRRQQVLEGIAFNDGRLEICFADGSVLTVLSSADFESWGLVGANGLRLISTPGGDLAVWRPSSD